MSNIDKSALREAAEKASTDNHTQDEWFHYLRCSTPETVLALLDELEAAEKRIAELEAKKVKIKLPESFYPDGDIDCPLVINEYQIIEAIVAADCKPIAVCPRCKCELDLSHKPDGAHFCHPDAAGKGE
ncbi:ead/Ea22-like family protein [Enterobacter hormaechei]|uniref:ead/Ea22-like family protein n=1 Tax=Enterobacter hormaechei TaxID=158836 RepID=UPI001EE1586C|nr:ead/Ea22-like family protein [Enterobacter hormaechei]